jgi:hypothetical protein
MNKYLISHGILHEDYTVIESDSLESATEYARELAKQEYESYEGLHGVLTEEECDEEGIDYEEEIEARILYSAEIYNHEKHKDLL